MHAPILYVLLFTFSESNPNCSSKTSFFSESSWFFVSKVCPILAASSKSLSFCKYHRQTIYQLWRGNLTWKFWLKSHKILVFKFKVLNAMKKIFSWQFFVFGDAIDVINLNRTFLQKPSYRKSQWFTSLALNLSDFLYQGILSPQIYRRTRPACTFGCFYFYEKLPLDSIFVLCNRIDHLWGLLFFWLPLPVVC